MGIHLSWNELSTGLQTGLIVLIIIEVLLVITGIVAWLRTPPHAMPGPNKWLWLAIIALLQFLGTPIFLLVRAQTMRNTPSEDSRSSASHQKNSRDSETADRAIDLLYGNGGKR